MINDRAPIVKWKQKEKKKNTDESRIPCAFLE